MVSNLGKSDAFDNLAPGSEGILAFFPFSNKTRSVFLNKLIINGPTMLLRNHQYPIKGFFGVVDLKMRLNIRG